jgi:hypothetical protein
MELRHAGGVEYGGAKLVLRLPSLLPELAVLAKIYLQGQALLPRRRQISRQTILEFRGGVECQSFRPLIA